MEISQTLQAIARLLNLCGATLEDAFVICVTIQGAGKEEEKLKGEKSRTRNPVLLLS